MPANVLLAIPLVNLAVMSVADAGGAMFWVRNL